MFFKFTYLASFTLYRDGEAFFTESSLVFKLTSLASFTEMMELFQILVLREIFHEIKSLCSNILLKMHLWPPPTFIDGGHHRICFKG